MNERIFIEYREGGSLANAYSVQLASLNDVYGIKKSDGTVVIASGTSVSNPSTGVYEYELDAELNTQYIASWKIVPAQGDEPVYTTATIGPFVVQSTAITSSQVRAVADYRGTFLQGKLTTMQLKLTDMEGVAVDPIGLTVAIYEEGNTSSSVSSGTPEKIQKGFYIYDWTIPADADIGPYSVVWSYQINNTNFTVTQGIIVIADSTNAGAQSPFSERIALMRASVDYHLGKIQALPVKNEQGIISDDNQTVKFNFPRWNQNYLTRIYRNGKLVTGGITINYFKGEVIFDEYLHERYDYVNADYNFRWFKDEEIDRFMSSAIQFWNTFPPSSNRSLQNIEDKYIPAVLWGAVIDAMRRMIIDLTTQEPIEVFGGPEMAKAAAQSYETVKRNFEDQLKMMVDAKAKGPYKGLTKLISVPEFTLPGGRSRWFRYMMGGFNLT